MLLFRGRRISRPEAPTSSPVNIDPPRSTGESLESRSEKIPSAVVPCLAVGHDQPSSHRAFPPFGLAISATMRISMHGSSSADAAVAVAKGGRSIEGAAIARRPRTGRPPSSRAAHLLRRRTNESRKIPAVSAVGKHAAARLWLLFMDRHRNDSYPMKRTAQPEEVASVRPAIAGLGACEEASSRLDGAIDGAGTHGGHFASRCSISFWSR